MGRCVMLALLSRSEAVISCPLFWLIFPQAQIAYYPGEAAVGDNATIFFLEDFTNTNHITPAGWAVSLSPQDTFHSVPGDVEDTADLSDCNPLQMQGQDSLFCLGSFHGYHTS